MPCCGAEQYSNHESGFKLCLRCTRPLCLSPVGERQRGGGGEGGGGGDLDQFEELVDYQIKGVGEWDSIGLGLDWEVGTSCGRVFGTSALFPAKL